MARLEFPPPLRNQVQLAEPLRKIRTKLAQDFGLVVDLVFFTRLDKAPPLQSSHVDIVLRVSRAKVNSEAYSSHGTIAARHTRTLAVQVRQRLYTDKAGHHDAWMLGIEGSENELDALGHLGMEELVLLSLCDYNPLVQGDTQEAFTEPMAPTESTDFDDVVKDDPTWGSSLVFFTMLYNPVLRAPGLQNEPLPPIH